IAVAAFSLDFTVIHPFADGNGRISRLLTNLILDRAGYDVGRYVSIERQIEKTKNRYYDSLLASTIGWASEEHDVWPWIAYLVETLDVTYNTFAHYAEQERSRGSKQDRVRRHLQEHARDSFTMGDLRQALPGISDSTMRVVLHSLRDQHLVSATAGRSGRWSWRGPNPSTDSP
ncbi:MAG TPA: Fic family protein, partial [Candidatus Dormibacteraeota bacterium]|nr:Fic family protein [Candidatus Dormibacteraeota bacterium]